MITEQRIISPFTPKVSPIRIAAACYKKWKSDVPFIDDLDDYMLNGVVISLPYLFAMAKVIDVAPEGSKEREPAWFVRMAVGDLRVLLANLPCYLPKICFCRRNDGRMRVYDTARLIKLAYKDINHPQISQINTDFQKSNLRKSGSGESADKNKEKEE